MMENRYLPATGSENANKMTATVRQTLRQQLGRLDPDGQVLDRGVVE